MSRTKNRGMETAVLTAPYARTWNIGKYVRLSKEDMNRGGDDSNSVANQRRLLDEYCQRHFDDAENEFTYVDDGYTGTDTNREGFQKLIADVMSKKVNCVIVKDLSRLSRNYTDAGGLIENLFVQMNVRFISLAENVDSYTNPDSVSSILVPITNVMNDQYCYQTSKKIRQVFDYKRRNGEFIGSFASYGYMRDPNDKHALVVDEEAAEVVKNIYSLFLGGMSKHAMAHHLNDHGILSPAEYKVSKGLNFHYNKVSGKVFWGAGVIDNILKNRIYVGDMVQGKRRVKSYKIHTIENVPESEWYIVENTHEPIIDRDTFEKVQQLLKRDTRTSPMKKGLYPFSGFLKCADCGRAMGRSTSSGHVYYHCTTYKQQSKSACTSHAIKHNRLEAAVLYAIKQQVYLAVSYSEIISRINAAPNTKSQSARLDSLITAKEKELAKITRYKQSLYEDWKDGVLTRNDYRHMSEDYERQAAAIVAVIGNLKVEQSELEKGVDIENPFLTTFRKHENIDKLTREIMVELIDHIKIYDNGNISVKFNYSDEFRRVAEYVELNTQQAAI